MNIISLFSGAGGLDLGFKEAGFNILWANENNKNTWATHERNFPQTILSKDSITQVVEKKLPDCIGIIGGPPCQSFSGAGMKAGTEDPRGQLFWDYIRILTAKKPLFFVAENVPGLLTERHKDSLASFLKAFQEAGYTVALNLYLASDYGIPQDRTRLFFVGYREDTRLHFSGLQDLNERKTLRDVLIGLFEPSPIKNAAVNSCLSPINHEYMIGGFSSMFMSRNRVRGWDETSFTILATARQISLHPQAPKMEQVHKDLYKFKTGFEHLYRRLSVRECARIQTFPDNFTFIYDKIEDGYKMVGNAVPVYLAKQIATVIKTDLNLL